MRTPTAFSAARARRSGPVSALLTARMILERFREVNVSAMQTYRNVRPKRIGGDFKNKTPSQSRSRPSSADVACRCSKYF